MAAFGCERVLIEHEQGERGASIPSARLINRDGLMPWSQYWLGE
jgi:hypothetical protein